MTFQLHDPLVEEARYDATERKGMEPRLQPPISVESSWIFKFQDPLGFKMIQESGGLARHQLGKVTLMQRLQSGKAR
jgi:hypothetical protein